jgi:hypothetical protein
MYRFIVGRHVVVAVLLLVGGVALAACSSGGSRPSTDATAVAGRDTAAVLRELVQCARAHGMPNLPDPQIDANGQPHWPGGEPPVPPESVMRACRSIIHRLPPQPPGEGADAGNVPSLIRFAACIRAHGFPEFPDPLPDGKFDASAFPSGVKPGNPPFDAAMRACRQLNPDPNGEIHAH